MLRRVVLACLCVTACSRSELDGSPNDPVLSRKASCSSPVVATCTGLRVLTVDEPLDGPVLASAVVGQTDHFDVLSETGFVQSLVVSGGALHLGAGRALSFSGAPGSVVTNVAASGGHEFLVTIGPNVASLRAFDSDYAPTAAVTLDDASTNTEHVASLDDLVLVQYERVHGKPPRLAILDARGAVVHEEQLDSQTGLAQAWGFPGVYGCGFFYAATVAQNDPVPIRSPHLTTIPVDGRAESTLSLPPAGYAAFAPWAYDSSAIAMTWVDQVDGGDCRTHLHVVRDDASVLIDESLPSPCDPPAMTYAPPAPARVLATSFGAVLRLPDWSLVLLDPSGGIVGSPVHVTIADPSKEYQMLEASAGPYVLLLTGALGAATPRATLVTCQ